MNLPENRSEGPTFPVALPMRNATYNALADVAYAQGMEPREFFQSAFENPDWSSAGPSHESTPVRVTPREPENGIGIVTFTVSQAAGERLMTEMRQSDEPVNEFLQERIVARAGTLYQNEQDNEISDFLPTSPFLDAFREASGTDDKVRGTNDLWVFPSIDEPRSEESGEATEENN
jgi:hypothetical protein